MEAVTSGWVLNGRNGYRSSGCNSPPEVACAGAGEMAPWIRLLVVQARRLAFKFPASV